MAVLLRLLPFIVVVLCAGFAYVIWRQKRAAQASGDTDAAVRIAGLSGLGLWCAIIVTMLVVGLFLFIGLAQEKNAGAAYEPTRIENGQLVPEQLER